MAKHPGGHEVIRHWAGKDATAAFNAFHPVWAEKPRKMLKSMLVGRVDASYDKEKEGIRGLEAEFEEVRQWALSSKLFEPKYSFYLAHFVSIVLIEALAWYILYHGNVSWGSLLLATPLFVTAQAQAGWLQHDLGHLSVFSSNADNKWAHRVVIGFLKAASSNWWNWRHFQHHSKPNVIRLDPDVKMAYFFLIGDSMPKVWGEKKKGHRLYRWQHLYWFLIAPPALLPVYFHIEVIARVIHKKDWGEALWILSFFGRWWALGAPLFAGTEGSVGYGMLV